MIKHLLHRASDTIVILCYYSSSTEDRIDVSQKNLYNLTVKYSSSLPVARIRKVGLWSKMFPLPTNSRTVLFYQAGNGKFHNVKQKIFKEEK